MSGSVFAPGTPQPVPAHSTAVSQGGVARLYDAILSQVAAVPLPIVQMALWDAIEEFCRRSCLWRETVQFVMDPGVVILDLNPIDDGTRAIWIWRVTGLERYQVRPPVTLVDLGDYTDERRGTALVVCKPYALSEYGIPSLLADDWSEALRDGALWRLFITPQKPWSDAKLAQYYGNRFRAAIFQAKESVRRAGDIPEPRFPYFALGHQRGTGIWSGGFGTPPANGTDQLNGQGPLFDNAPLPVNTGDAADIDGGDFDDDPTYGDIEGGRF
jgi:hypothetical protein